MNISTPSDPIPFAELGPNGKNHWSRYLTGTILILLGWMLLTVVVTLAAYIFGQGAALELVMQKANWVDLGPEQDGQAMVAVTYILLTLISLLIATLLIARWVHGQSVLTLLTSRSRFDFRAFAISGGVFLLLNLLLFIFGQILDPSALEFVFDGERMLPFIVLVLLLTPFQCLAEEVFFRGYLFQGVSATTKNVVIRLGVPALLFTGVHASNGDWSAGGLWAVSVYFGMALYLGWLTLKSGGLELSAGMHTANNLFAFTIVTSAGSGMPFATVFYDPSPDYSAGALFLIPLLVVHYLIVTRLVPASRT